MKETTPPDPVWEGMPRKQFDRIGRYIRDVANILGLYDWKLELSHLPLDKDTDAHAEVRVTFGRRHASISLAWDFLEADVDELETALIHEVLHVCLDPMRSSLRDAVRPLIGRPAWTVLDATMHEKEERVVDDLAHGLRPIMPRLKVVKPKGSP